MCDNTPHMKNRASHRCDWFLDLMAQDLQIIVVRTVAVGTLPPHKRKNALNRMIKFDADNFTLSVLIQFSSKILCSLLRVSCHLS